MRKIKFTITVIIPDDMFWDLQNMISRLRQAIKQIIILDDGKLLNIEAKDEQ